MARPWAQAAAAILLTLAAATLWAQRTSTRHGSGAFLSDSVVVTERVGARRIGDFVISGRILPSPSLSVAARGGPTWVAELAPPWVNASISPDERYVAVERITPSGTDVYVITATQRDTLLIATGAGDDLVGGWSPDSHWLLVINASSAPDGSGSTLQAYSTADPGASVALGTAGTDGFVNAVWSPTGTHIAWTARGGPTRQQDVFIARSDGAGARNVTANLSEDYHPAWSPDGEWVVFTSDRAGDAELYSVELATNEVRRLTFNTAQDDVAAFSPDGDFIAFESTREGRVGIYAMPRLGGSARRLTPAGRNFELVGWRGRSPSYVADLRVDAPSSLLSGASATVAVAGVDQYGAAIPVADVEWEAMDSSIALGRSGVAASRTLVARGRGMGRIVAKAGSWRADTAFILIGAPPFTVLSDDFSSPRLDPRWSVLGVPAPVQSAAGGGNGGGGLVLRSDRQWESGLLAREAFPLRPGLSASARVRGPFSSTGDGVGFTLAFVAAESPATIDSAAPQFLRLAAMSWLPEARRMAYSAEREFFSEVVRFSNVGDWQTLRITVEEDGRVAFYVGGTLRRRSTIRVTELGAETRVQLWIGGRGTGDAVLVDDVAVWIDNAR